MRDYDEKMLRGYKPSVSPSEAIEFCLEALCRDTVRKTTDEVCEHLTYEELLGALVLADEALKNYRKMMNESHEKVCEAYDLLREIRDPYHYC